MRSTILTKFEQEFVSKLGREAKSYKFEQGAKSYQNSNANTILAKFEQEFLPKLEREAKSYKFERGTKSYQNSNAKHNPSKIRAGILIKTRAGSKIV